MKPFLSIAVLLTAFALSGCAVAQQKATRPIPLRLDEVTAMVSQNLSDDDFIKQIEQHGAAFVVSANDLEKLRTDGVSDGVLRYLQGRASGEQALKQRIISGRYRLPMYTGLAYVGSPYLGYYDGFHYYGRYSPYYFGYVSTGHHYTAHSAGGHHGGHHGGGHH